MLLYFFSLIYELYFPRSFHTFLANANPEALSALGGPGMTPEMIKTMSNMVSNMSPEELQKMLEVASSLNGTNPLIRPGTSGASESQTSVASSSVRNNLEASTSSSRSTFLGSEMPPSFNSSSTGDVQEQMRNQMKDPAMRQVKFVTLFIICIWSRLFYFSF